jgi:hypothetical protein
MSIEATLERIAAALEAIARAGTSLPVPAAEPVKRGPGRPPKIEAAPAAEEPAREESFLDEEAEPEKPLTVEEVRAALVDYQKRSGSAEKARGILKQYGHCDTLRSLKPENYAAVFAAAATGK